MPTIIPYFDIVITSFHYLPHKNQSVVRIVRQFHNSQSAMNVELSVCYINIIIFKIVLHNVLIMKCNYLLFT